MFSLQCGSFHVSLLFSREHRKQLCMPLFGGFAVVVAVVVFAACFFFSLVGGMCRHDSCT